ncbi:MAG TPA: glycogen debranching protein GlgX [Kiritimatiellia bacterium]|nr:glycogen debranching protein GlgX [Kiritimatiellia bacterium]
MNHPSGKLLPSIPMPVPYGAHVVESGVQFTIFSRHATRVWLMLFDHPDADSPSQEYTLTPEANRIGDIWHIHLRDARPGQYYAYRMEGIAPPGHRNYFNPHQWLLDPYALAVTGSPRWGDPAGLQPGQPPVNGRTFPKGVIVRDDFDWSDDRRFYIPLEESIIYECHLRGFTAHESSGVGPRGTYDGFKEKIPYLRDLGVNVVEFLPIQEFNEMEYFLDNGSRKHLHNYWGYSTLAFFAPNGRYANRGVYGQQLTEFKDLVMALHREGIEVILDVVFNHTAEGGDGGPTYSFRGIDNSIYYMMDKTGLHYMNYSGCGNTVNSNHPIVRDFIISCLRYWVLHMHVDGFRFDLASILTRGKDGEILPDPPLVEIIAEDPVLRQTKIIAEAWDAAGAYQVGEFPSDRWSEWNGRYRDDIRRFWRGDRGQLGALATRLTGSADLYQKDGQSPTKSINFITAHDGFTLRDLVTYHEKLNHANNEGNRDGENHNESRNFGHEGPTNDPAINARRLQQQKNFLATLFFSQGIPMLVAGDEFSRTQHGNNNAYCQDNPISWIDWTLAGTHRDLLDFVRACIRIRKDYPSLRRTTFFKGQANHDQDPDIQWFGPNGHGIDWDNGLALGCMINGSRRCTGAKRDLPHLALVVNASDHDEPFTLPDISGKPWELLVHSHAQPPPWRHPHRDLLLPAGSLALFTLHWF